MAVSHDWSSTAVFAGVATALFLAFKFLQFVLADADLSLLQKRPPSANHFRGKTVWITGASKGIGAVLAVRLYQLGANLILSARDVSQLETVKAQCLRSGKQQGDAAADRVRIFPLDLTGGRQALEAAAKKASEMTFNSSNTGTSSSQSGVDILVHAAAFTRVKELSEDSPEQFLRNTLEVNVIAAIELTRAMLPFFQKRGSGHIVVISSAAGIVPSPTQAVYAASKHALHGYFNSLQYEVCHRNVHITMVCPGPVAEPVNSEQSVNSTQAEGSTEAGGEKKEKRVSCERCADLIVTAIAHKVPEAWISLHPVLMVMYLMQLCPPLGRTLLRVAGPKRVATLKGGGKNLYSFSLLLKKSD